MSQGMVRIAIATLFLKPCLLFFSGIQFKQQKWESTFEYL